MHRLFRLFAIFSTLLLSMCTVYDQSGSIVSLNGLSCQNRTDYGLGGGQQAATCYYKCPDGTIRRPELDEEFTVSSPLYGASKDEVDAQFCQGVSQPTASQPVPTDLATDAPTDLPTEAAVTAAPPTEILSSPTAGIVVQNLPPLLRGDVTMCDVAINLINFRMIEPVPELAETDLEVQIGDQPTTCFVNPTNTSLLSCNIPAGVTFPARVFVSLDGATVNDFIYDGLGCAKIATAFPTTTP
ncbi:MAG TPA: hypothetical protein VJ830_05430 [Anaerolineales bacterium]|nr:hypothetical protein [Anaerolineales bacterium]